MNAVRNRLTIVYGTKDVVRHVANKRTILNSHRRKQQRPGAVAVYNADGLLTAYLAKFKR